PPQDQGAGERRGAPPHVHGQLDISDLTTAALAVVIGVLAVGGARTVVIHLVAKLADVLYHHVHAMGVALAQVSAARVGGPPPPELKYAARHVVAPFTDRAETVAFEQQYRREREGVVAAGQLDVFRLHARIAEDDALGEVARLPGDRRALVVHGRERLVD